MAGERTVDFLTRQERQRQTFPELSVFNSPREQQQVDRMRLEEGRPLTSIGQQIRDLYTITAPEDNRTRIFNKPQGFVKPPLTKAPLPDPDRSTSPFRLAEQARFEEQQAVNERVREVTGALEGPQAGLPLAGAVGSTVDRFTGAPIRGALMDRNPIRGAIRGFNEPEKFANQLDLPLINRLPENDLIFGLSTRDIAAGVASSVLDVGTIAGAAGLTRGSSFGDDIVRRSIVGVDTPIDSSVRGFGQVAMPPEIIRQFRAPPLLPIGERSAPDVIAAKPWFHGSRASDLLTPSNLDAAATRPDNLFGQGVYLTDNPQVAATYARRPRPGFRYGTRDPLPTTAPDPNVYQVRVHPQRVLDMEEPLSDELFSALEAAARSIGADAVNTVRAMDAPGLSLTNEQAYQRFVDDVLRGEDVGGDALYDIMASFADSLRRDGFDALTHTGGVRTGNQRHQVLILLDPQDSLATGRPGGLVDIAPTDPRAFTTATRVNPTPGTVRPLPAPNRWMAYQRTRTATRAGIVPIRGGALSTLIDPPTINELRPSIKSSNNPVIRAIIGQTGIDRSILEDTDIGQIALAHIRARVASEGIVDTALAATFDAHAQRFSGRSPFGRFGHIFKVDTDGFIRNVDPRPGFENASRAWNDVLSNPERFNFTPEQQSFWDDIRGLLDEVETIRVAEGLTPRARTDAPDGWFYFPRSVTELEGVIKERGMNPGLARTYDEMLQGMQNGVNYSTDLRAVLEAHLRGAYEEITNARLNRAVEPFTVPRPEAGSEFARLPSGELTGVRSWRNQFLRREDAETLTRLVGDFGQRGAEGNLFSRGFNNVGDAIRYHAAGFDFGAPFIQGIPLLTRNPAVWARSTFNHYLAFLDPSVQGRFIRDHIDTYTAMARAGVPVGDVEFFTALENGNNIFGATEGLLRRMPKVGDNLALGPRFLEQQVGGRFQSSYDTFLSTSRALMWEAMSPSWNRRGGDAFSLARHIRNITGGLDSRSLGIGATQRQFESTWLAFSPRLVRSTFALAGEMLSSDPVIRSEAIRTNLQMLSGISMLYVAAGIGLGKSEEEIRRGLNPLNGKEFLSFNINGDWIGVGGMARSTVQLLSSIVANDVFAAASALNEDPQNIRGALGKFRDEGSLFANLDNRNTIFDWYQSRGAVGLSLAGATLEATTGLNAEPFADIYTPVDLARHVGTSMIPFAVQGHLEGEQPVTTAFAAGGFRTSPQTPGERRTELLDSAVQPLTGQTFEQFAETEGRNSALSIAREALKQNNPQALAEFDQLEADRIHDLRERAAHGDNTAIGLVASIDARDEIKDFINEHPTDYVAIRDAVSAALSEARVIREQPQVQDALSKMGGADTEVEQDINAYFALFDIEDRDQREAAEADFINQIGQDRYSRVLRNTFAVTSDMPQQFLDLQATKLGLTETGYFQRDQIAWQAIQQQLGGTLDQFPSYFAWRDAAIEFAKDALRQQGYPEATVNDAARDYMENINPFSKQVVDWMSEARSQLDASFVQSIGATNPDLVGNAIKYGYIRTNRSEREALRGPLTALQ